MLIDKFRIKGVHRGCSSNDEYMTLQAESDMNLAELFPYINRAVHKTSYNIKAEMITIKKEMHTIKIQNNNILITRIRDLDEGERMLGWLTDVINDIDVRRHEIEPSYEEGRVVSVIEIYKLLPKKNCGQCGSPTCMAFASQVLQGSLETENCPWFKEDKYTEMAEKLHLLLYN